MVDMHLHTYYSDGTLSPAELVKRAAEKGIKIMSITDHDGLNGVDEGIKAGEEMGIMVIPGIELSTVLTGGEVKGFPEDYSESIVNMHILGYEIDIKNEELNRTIDYIRKKREDRNEKLLAAFNKIGLNISSEDLIQRQGQDYVGKPNFALALIKRGYTKSAKEANTAGMYLKHPKTRGIHREKIHVKEALTIIKNAGGYGVLAHPMKVKFPHQNNGLPMDDERKFYYLDKLLDQLIGWGLSGMECYYSSHSQKQTQELVAIAKNKGLLITAGSDFHGPSLDPNLDIGMVGLEPAAVKL